MKLTIPLTEEVDVICAKCQKPLEGHIISQDNWTRSKICIAPHSCNNAKLVEALRSVLDSLTTIEEKMLIAKQALKECE